MRIISGQFKGRTIEFLKNLNTRPLKDSVKESIFNIIGHSSEVMVKLKNSNVLDLYSELIFWFRVYFTWCRPCNVCRKNNPKTLKI